MMIHSRYIKKDGAWYRTSLAFECFTQWLARNPHREDTPREPIYRPRRYHAWPITERVTGEEPKPQARRLNIGVRHDPARLFIGAGPIGW